MRKLLVVLALAAALPLSAAPPAKATFAGGCFWCMEAAFEKLPGVISAVSGYTGGRKPDPTYDDVSNGTTGHRESVEVTYDPSKITYGQLLDVFWHNIDPTDPFGQFCDQGEQYTAAIFVHGEAQRKLAELSLQNVRKRFGKVATIILPASRFYPAEDYHQDYSRKNPIRYHLYRSGCGRDARLKEVWK